MATTKHFNSDGTVKREFPGAVSFETFPREEKNIARVWGSNALLDEFELSEGEQVGESFNQTGLAKALTASALEDPVPEFPMGFSL